MFSNLPSYCGMSLFSGTWPQFFHATMKSLKYIITSSLPSSMIWKKKRCDNAEEEFQEQTAPISVQAYSRPHKTGFFRRYLRTCSWVNSETATCCICNHLILKGWCWPCYNYERCLKVEHVQLQAEAMLLTFKNRLLSSFSLRIINKRYKMAIKHRKRFTHRQILHISEDKFAVFNTHKIAGLAGKDYKILREQ